MVLYELRFKVEFLPSVKVLILLDSILEVLILKYTEARKKIEKDLHS